MRLDPKHGGTSPITTRGGCTSRWIIERQQRSTERGGGRREEKAFFFAPHDLSRGEGRVGRKRMPGEQAEKERHETG
jgi:hypothetical protein